MCYIELAVVTGSIRRWEQRELCLNIFEPVWSYAECSLGKIMWYLCRSDLTGGAFDSSAKKMKYHCSCMVYFRTDLSDEQNHLSSSYSLTFWPGRCQYNAQWFWSSPLTEVRIVKCVWVIAGCCITVWHRHSRNALPRSVLLCFILMRSSDARPRRAACRCAFLIHVLSPLICWKLFWGKSWEGSFVTQHVPIKLESYVFAA